MSGTWIVHTARSLKIGLNTFMINYDLNKYELCGHVFMAANRVLYVCILSMYLTGKQKVVHHFVQRPYLAQSYAIFLGFTYL